VEVIGQVRLPCPFGAGRYLFLANRSEISSNSPDSSISACIHTALPYNPLMFSFIETKLFTRLVQKYLTDDEYQEVQALLIKNPNAGEVVPKTGGVRKLRWRAPGRGKRGGYRLIYFAEIEQGLIWMLTMYAKNVAENIPAHVLRAIRREVENG
jgi:hypothetical protein